MVAVVAKVAVVSIKHKNRYAERTCARYQYGSADLA